MHNYFEINPHYFRVLKDKELALQNLGIYKEALEYFDKTLKLNPNNIKTLIGKSTVLLKLHQYDEAIEFFDRFLSIQLDNPILNGMKSMVLKEISIPRISTITATTSTSINNHTPTRSYYPPHHSKVKSKSK
ncbi:MAG: tetratricopeptide repeat protein [Candidatus Nitrosocosmicus sp.]